MIYCRARVSTVSYRSYVVADSGSASTLYSSLTKCAGLTACSVHVVHQKWMFSWVWTTHTHTRAQNGTRLHAAVGWGCSVLSCPSCTISMREHVFHLLVYSVRQKHKVITATNFTPSPSLASISFGGDVFYFLSSLSLLSHSSRFQVIIMIVLFFPDFAGRGGRLSVAFVRATADGKDVRIYI